MMSLLNDPTYNKLKKDPTQRVEKKVSQALKEAENAGWISDIQRLHLTPQFSTPPQIYGLPKIHKPGTPPPPLMCTSRETNPQPLQPLGTSTLIQCCNVLEMALYFCSVPIHPFSPLKVYGKIWGLAAMVQYPTDYANVTVTQSQTNTIKERTKNTQSSQLIYRTGITLSYGTSMNSSSSFPLRHTKLETYMVYANTIHTKQLLC